MSKPPRRKFSEKYKADAVAMVRSSGQSVYQIAKDLGLSETALRKWVTQAQSGVPRSEVPAEEDVQSKLRRLEEENRVLRMERDFLKKAAAFFAKENS